MKPGDNIRNLREKKGLNQIEFARALGFSDAYISEVETGKKGPSKNLLNRIEEIFKIPGDYILYGGVSLDVDKMIEELQTIGADQEMVEKIKIHCLTAIYRSGREEWQRGFEHGRVSEPGPAYDVLPTSIKKLIDGLTEVMESENEVAKKALTSNIEAFLQMVRTSKSHNENKGDD